MKSRLLLIYIWCCFCLAAHWSCQRRNPTAQTPYDVEWASMSVDTTSTTTDFDTAYSAVTDTVVMDTLKSIDRDESVAKNDSTYIVDSVTVVPKLHPFSILGFSVAIAGVGFSVFTPLICMAGIIICVIALDRIKRKPEKFKGKRLAKWGLIISILGILIYLGTVVAIGL